MSQLLLNKWRKLAGMAAMLAVFVVVGTVDASAQSAVRANNDPSSNPNLSLATKLGVTACPLGSATNVQGGLAAVDAQRATLRSAINAGTATINDKFKYFYFEAVSNQVGHNYIAPEIALLEGLRAAANQAGSNAVTQQMMVNLYNSTKALFGMC